MKLAFLIPALLVSAWLAFGVQDTGPATRSESSGAHRAAASLERKPGGTALATRAGADQGADEARAQEILAQLAETYPSLEGVSVRIGDTPKDEEAVAYYTAGEIVIDRDHTVGIDRILAHEIWHVIDWRDNGRLDWGENLPPRNASDYR